MTRNELPPEKKKEYDDLVAACMKEIEEKVPKPQEAFDLRPDMVRRSITNKYLPKMERILMDADNHKATA